MFNETDQLAVHTLRALSVDQIESANSGHPGLPLGVAPMAYALFKDHLRIHPDVSDWPNRDRFVLSAGHGSALLYSLLHLSGFDVSMEDLKAFRQMDSKTPGHPEVGHTDGVEATTGPLGQGLAQAVGMAMAEQHTAALYNTADHTVIDHYTYALVSDGDLMEGISYEATSLAGRQKLGKLIFLYDSNDISLDGDLNQAFNEDIKGRFEAMNWHYQRVEDGNDLEAISQAISQAKEETEKPSLIEVRTIIGYGSPKQGTAAVHGAPLGPEDWQTTKEFYKYVADDFTVSEEVQAQFDEHVKDRGREAYEAWKTDFTAYQSEESEKADLFERAFSGELPEDYDSQLEYKQSGSEASRASSGAAINALAQTVPYLWGGSADLAGSNKTMIKDTEDFLPGQRQGRNIWFGVREFAMAAILNGIMLHGGTKVFGGTFFVFSDYLKPAVRVAALSKLPVTYVLTHDSVGVGEDGPTHEPIEQLAAFRATPNLNVIRPADVNETNAAWKIALESKKTPTMLVLSRQDLETLEHSADLADEGVARGAYVASPSQADQVDGILIATGSEVSLAVKAQALLAEESIDVSVVSMPSQELFDQQDSAYKESVLPTVVENRLSLELGSTFGWERYVGLKGASLGIDRFGRSAPGDEVIASFGFTPDQVVEFYKEKFK